MIFAASELPQYIMVAPTGGKTQDVVHIQGDETPICSECKTKMIFYAQLDSINDDFLRPFKY
jgi:hypothetical protein